MYGIRSLDIGTCNVRAVFKLTFDKVHRVAFNHYFRKGETKILVRFCVGRVTVGTGPGTGYGGTTRSLVLQYEVRRSGGPFNLHLAAMPGRYDAQPASPTNLKIILPYTRNYFLASVLSWVRGRVVVMDCETSSHEHRGLPVRPT